MTSTTPQPHHPVPPGPAARAAAVAFLAGPDGGWVNAQVLRVNGGYA